MNRVFVIQNGSSNTIWLVKRVEPNRILSRAAQLETALSCAARPCQELFTSAILML